LNSTNSRENVAKLNVNIIQKFVVFVWATYVAVGLVMMSGGFEPYTRIEFLTIWCLPTFIAAGLVWVFHSKKPN
jgi:hypothetical protein